MSKSGKGKTALVLAGGGLTGAVYEIGALRAIDDLLLDRTVNDFDIYVGTSAGALIATLLASGVCPEHMLSVIDGSGSNTQSIQRRHIFGLNYHELLNWGIELPPKLLNAWIGYLSNFREMTLFDLLWSLSRAIPAGIYDPMTLEAFIRNSLIEFGQSNDFRELKHQLYITTTELDSGERVVFGTGMREEVPISLAVAASSALPFVYQPVKISNREYIDGSLRGNASLDLAVEQGARLIICINPLVPYDHSSKLDNPYQRRRPQFLSDKGIQAVANQTFRIASHAGLSYHVKQLRRSFPEVDIILIEPEASDNPAFFDNMMSFSARMIVGNLGFESATLDLAEDYSLYKQILAKHGIPISRRLVIEEIDEIQRSGYDPRVIRSILGARTPRCGKSKRGKPVCELTRTLAELELILGVT